MIPRQLRFSDLKQLRIVGNRVTLDHWINNHGFPPGKLTGPNTRTWTEPEVSDWLESRPTEKKAVPASKKVA